MYLWIGKDSIISEQQWYSQYTYSHFRGLRCAVTFTDCVIFPGASEDTTLWASEWTVDVLCWYIIRSPTGVHTADPEQSAPAPESWVSPLLSERKRKKRKTLRLGPIFNVNSTESRNKIWKFTYIKPAAWHNAVNSFVGQLGAKEAQAPGHLVHYFRVVEALIRKPSQSVHLPH